MTWYGSYDAWGDFPDGNTSYSKILLRYTMGCATGGCSDWDYTTQIQLMIPTGVMDSNVASVDTVSLTPLVIDTTWNVFEVEEAYELARVITPYGGSLPNNWEHDFMFDVTDYYPLLKDSVKVRAFYSGWSSGFSVSTDFLFVEGIRPRTVLDIKNIHSGYKDYISSTAFESTFLTSKTVTLSPSAKTAMVRVIPSGHGFVNSLNCAEFCEKDYYLKINNQQVATQAMWRNDCGLNPIWPQAGTWLFDRANWCPGDKALHYDHDITSYISGTSSIDIDVDVEAYAYTVPPGEVPAGYYFTTQLFQYGDYTFANDVELTKILAPSHEDEFSRMNPICGKVILEIRNNGSQNLTSCTIDYGMEGGNPLTYNWTGNLAPSTAEVVSIDIPNPADWESYTGSLNFIASVSNPNGQPDEYSLNNKKEVTVTAPPIYPAQMILQVRTNAAASETFWSVKSADGTVITSQAANQLSNYTRYTDTLDLAPGCYELVVGDTDKDGMAFFANNDGSGSIQLRNNGGTFFSENFTANFGTEIRQYFTVGLGIGVQESSLQEHINLYPNPSNGKIHLEYYAPGRTDLSCVLTDVNGKPVWKDVFEDEKEFNKELDFSHLPAGMYFLQFNDGKGSFRKKIVLN
ncbi:MAG TPA: hypothetical protein DCG19_05045 [Cryomorphaceae bacterium]|nr:hypothetical protein [Cryomorphaceae bacterium]